MSIYSYAMKYCAETYRQIPKVSAKRRRKGLGGELERIVNLGLYFAHTHNSQEMGLSGNANASKLAAQYFPKKLYLPEASADEVVAAVAKLDERPRKVLNLKSSKDYFKHLIRKLRPAPWGVKIIFLSLQI